MQTFCSVIPPKSNSFYVNDWLVIQIPLRTPKEISVLAKRPTISAAFTSTQNLRYHNTASFVHGTGFVFKLCPLVMSSGVESMFTYSLKECGLFSD